MISSRCEPSVWGSIKAAFALLLVISPGAIAQSTGASASPEAALTLMSQGDTAGAMKQLAKLRISSNGRYAPELSGIFLLDRGDVSGASEIFREAIAHAPDESLLRYGRAVAQIGSHSLADAEHSLTSCEQEGGDAEAIRIARRYIEFLRGESSAKSEMRPSAADYAIDGMAAMRSGRHRDAVDLMQKAVAGGSGDPFLQSEGPLMSFDESKSISPGV